MKWNRLFVGVLALIPAVAGVGVSAQDGGGRAWGIYVDGDREEMAGGEENDGVVEDKVLEEVVVTGQGARQRFESLQLGAEKLELSKLALTPVLFGERDIVKSITLMPGVHGEGEGAGGFEVRGGTSAQNLVALDGISLYNPSHVMGIFSMFNDDALGGATLFKGPIPAGFGGATASVLETSLAPGDMDSYHASGTIGILAAKIKGEGPIVKERLSLAVTARRSYVDAFLQMVPQYRHTEMNFYDVTGKLRWHIKGGDYLDVSVLTSRDNMGISDLMTMRWGNTGVSANWIARRDGRWRFETTAAFTNYSADMGMEMMRSDQTLKEYIRNVSLNESVTYQVDDNHSLEWGARSELLRVKSGEFLINDSRQREVRSVWQNALWGSYEGHFGERFAVSAGLRLSLVSALSGEAFHEFEAINEPEPDFSPKTYFMPEPRVSMRYDFNGLHNIKGGVSVTTQNLHSIRSSATSFPFDRYALTSAGVRPQSAAQYGIAYNGMTVGGDWEWSAEGYYKDIENVYDYRDGRTMFSNTCLESLISGGEGRSYGAEFMVRKNSGRLTGWISYTLSKTQTRIAGINGGHWYDATNDRRHYASVVAIFRLTDRWSLSGAWTYSSGQRLTAPDVKYELDGGTCYYYSRRNGYRTPPSHRLDLSATYTRHGKRLTTQWALGVYNAYCHYSPYIIYFEDDESRPSGTRAVQRSLFGVVPSVSYTLKF